MVGAPAQAQEIRDLDRDRARSILRNVEREIEDHFYDPEFRGLDLTERFQKAEAALEQATSIGQAFGSIALAVMELGDSHTWFLPPSRTFRVEYGWRVQAFGDSCFVTAVKPGTDAEAKGLRPGDRVLAVDGYALTRENLRLFRYRYYVLQPQETVRLVVADGGGQERELEIAGEVSILKRLLNLADSSGMDYWQLLREAEGARSEHRFRSFGDGQRDKKVLWWDLPAFAGERALFKRAIAKARDHEALILDLRGNLGGRVDRLLELAGHLFDHDVQVAQPRGREPLDPLVAETSGNKAFQGKLVVLVDSRSASASELLARIVQLEGRGVVLGDRTAGAVTMSRVYPQKLGGNRVILYSIQVATADLLLPDGKRLEGGGVVPDQLVLPTGTDLVSGDDPVLAYAMAILGVDLDPSQAGEITRFEWD